MQIIIPSGKRFWITAAAVAALAGGGVLLAGHMVESETVPQVQVATPERNDVESSAMTTGLVVPVTDFLARANNGGMVQKVLVRLGDRVQAGQLLVLMRDPFAASRLASAQATLRADQVGLQNTLRGGSQEDEIQFSQDLQRMQGERASAERNLQTLTALLQTGGASQAEVRAAQQRLGGAEANLKVLHERMTHRYSAGENRSWSAKVQEGQAAVAAEQTNLASVQIASPIAGTAYLVEAHQDDFVGPGAELVHVADLSRMQVLADFDEADAAKVRTGEPVLLRWEARPDKLWHGHIERAPLAFTGNGARRVGQSLISVEDARGDLPAASTVTVTAIDQKHTQVLTLPREALHIEGPNRFVYRVVRDQLERVPVQTGIVAPDRFEVTGGIGPGDQVALHRMDHQDLTPRTHVEVVP